MTFSQCVKVVVWGQNNMAERVKKKENNTLLNSNWTQRKVLKLQTKLGLELSFKLPVMLREHRCLADTVEQHQHTLKRVFHELTCYREALSKEILA